MSKLIRLSRGLFATVDNEDFDALSARNWHAVPNGPRADGTVRWYARASTPRNGGHSSTVSMHRMLLNPPKSAMIDHIDGDGLNNTRANLRLASDRQNQHNARKALGCRSRWKGVSFSDNRWQARITVDGQTLNIGSFRTEDEAAIAYDLAAIKHFGEFARTNSPRPLLDAAEARERAVELLRRPNAIYPPDTLLDVLEGRTK